MNRQHTSLAGLTATLLLIALATVACARGGGATGEPQATSVATVTASAAATDTTSVVSSAATDTASVAQLSPTSDPPAVKSSAASGAIAASGASATVDPLDTDLQKLNQVLQGVQDSLSGANSGGE